jgi:hypothetical protein
MTRAPCLCALCLLCVLCSRASAQWEFDARQIALGSSSGTANLASDMVEQERPYRSIVLPFGLLQVLRDFDIYDPGSSRFDPVRAIEHIASPIHYIVNRDSAAAGEAAFVSALRNGQVSRDLNVYRGFAPAAHIDAGGVAAPGWGRTIELARTSGAHHGVYIGAGPYLSLTTTNDFDDRLAALLASATPVVIPNAQLTIANASQGQAAAAITVGYRGSVPLPSAAARSRDRLYLAVNYDYLLGFRFADDALRLRIDTDAAGLVTIAPGATPLAIPRLSSTSGRGSAVDVGVGASVGPLAVGFGVNRIGNHIVWTDVTRTTYSLQTLVSGVFIESGETPVADVRVELPLDVRADATYDTGPWTVAGEIGSSIGGGVFHAGVERRLPSGVALRGGAKYSFAQWNPTGGVGVDLTPRVALDVAAFGASVNIERRRLLGLAASVRIKTQPE